MRISNDSVSAAIRSYALAARDGASQVVWLELAPQHPKIAGAIWASLVNGAGELLYLNDEQGKTHMVQGLGRRYERLVADAPRIAGRARPKFVRLVAPEALAQPPEADFIALEWPGQTAGQTLAAMLERGTPYPIRIGWGDCLLQAAIDRDCARPLIASSNAPQGYLISGQTPWAEIIQESIRRSRITLDGALDVDAAVEETVSLITQPMGGG